MPRTLVYALHALNAVVLLMVTAKGLLAWPRIPRRVPAHFNAWGVADRWGVKGPEFAILFALPWFFSLLLYGMRAGIGYFAKRPHLANLSPKLRGLPPERLRPLFAAIQDLLLGAVTTANLMLGAALHGTLKVALGAADRMPLWTTPPPWLVVLGSVVLVGVVRVFAIQGRLKRE